MDMPIYYPERSTLRKVIYQYNGEEYQVITLNKMLSGVQGNILGIEIPETDNAPDPIYTQMLFNTLQRYMFAEIGFDIDEVFIERFQSRWSMWAEYYYNILHRVVGNSGLFDRTIQRNGTTNITEKRDIDESHEQNLADTGIETTTVNDTINGETTGSGDRTEYEVNTQHSTATNNTESTQDRTESKTLNTKHVRTGTDTRDENNTHDTVTEQNVTETEITAEKFNLLTRANTIIDEFSELFNNLFMQVFTTM